MTFSRCVVTENASVADLPGILAFVEDACQQAHVTPCLVFDVQLAVEEACANVIDHAYRGQGGALQINFEALNGDVIITLHDWGHPFDPDAIVPPDTSLPLRQRPIGGLGLHLMHRLMDEVKFSFGPEGNALRMVKRNAVHPAAAECQEEADG